MVMFAALFRPQLFEPDMLFIVNERYIKAGFWKIVHVDTGNYRKTAFIFWLLNAIHSTHILSSVYNPSDSTVAEQNNINE